MPEFVGHREPLTVIVVRFVYRNFECPVIQSLTLAGNLRVKSRPFVKLDTKVSDDALDVDRWAGMLSEYFL